MRRFILCAFLISSAVAVGGCEDEASKRQRQNKQDQQRLTDMRVKMAASVPVPDLKTSAERQAVARRAKTWNNEDKLSYVYLIDTGHVMAFYVVRGKVSSLNSYMLPGEPDIDGTYGQNVEGVFFFTDTGAYVEWNGRYICSDQPLRLAQEPLLIREVAK